MFAESRRPQFSLAAGNGFIAGTGQKGSSRQCQVDTPHHPETGSGLGTGWEPHPHALWHKPQARQQPKRVLNLGSIEQGALQRLRSQARNLCVKWAGGKAAGNGGTCVWR